MMASRLGMISFLLALASQITPCSAEDGVTEILAERLYEREEADSINGSSPYDLKTETFRVDVNHSFGRTTLGAYLDLRRTEGSVGFFDLEADGFVIAGYGAREIASGVFAGFAASYSKDEGELISFFGPAELSFPSIDFRPFIIGLLPLPFGELFLEAGVNSSHSKLRIQGQPTDRLEVHDADLTAILKFPLHGPLSGEIGGDLRYTFHEDTAFGGAARPKFSPKLAAGVSLRLGEQIALLLGGSARPFDKGREETTLSLSLIARSAAVRSE